MERRSSFHNGALPLRPRDGATLRRLRTNSAQTRAVVRVARGHEVLYLETGLGSLTRATAIRRRRWTRCASYCCVGLCAAFTEQTLCNSAGLPASPQICRAVIGASAVGYLSSSLSRRKSGAGSVFVVLYSAVQYHKGTGTVLYGAAVELGRSYNRGNQHRQKSGTRGHTCPVFGEMSFLRIQIR